MQAWLSLVEVLSCGLRFSTSAGAGAGAGAGEGVLAHVYVTYGTWVRYTWLRMVALHMVEHGYRLMCRMPKG